MRDRPLIIGISGRARHGKDVVASVLFDEFFVQRLAFADHLKWLAMHTWGLTWDQVYGDSKEVVDERWGVTPRHFLKMTGTEVVRHAHKDTWVRKAFDTINRAHRGEYVVVPEFREKAFKDWQFAPGAADKWAIPDCRFADEANAIKEQGGVIIKVVRPGLDRPTDTHASEMGVDDVKEDHLILNDGTLDDLKVKVRAVGELILYPAGFQEAVRKAELMGGKP